MGITLPGAFVGGIIALVAMIVFDVFHPLAMNWLEQLLFRMGFWQMEFWLSDSPSYPFLGLFVFFVAFVLFAFLPWWLVSKLIRKRLLTEESS
ncbi:hypothetical protein [Ktedonobacter racemifer]|uniref:Uncharacterized protein n=1 Tax=Ktedonobacter racemifer DSM 44963 TaxID=485913 RepID=D6TXJ4_KTERA|nr:hypothetical protein [Ktedonobacter racemifer]EFH84927.1 hypothetical protein Krac_6049 [Ktedonobacter racemifer DSM 44963]